METTTLSSEMLIQLDTHTHWLHVQTNTHTHTHTHIFSQTTARVCTSSWSVCSFCSRLISSWCSRDFFSMFSCRKFKQSNKLLQVQRLHRWIDLCPLFYFIQSPSFAKLDPTFPTMQLNHKQLSSKMWCVNASSREFCSPLSNSNRSDSISNLQNLTKLRGDE